MAYVEGRVVHDADSHIMETSEMLADFASERVKRHLLGFDGRAPLPPWDGRVPACGVCFQPSPTRCSHWPPLPRR